MNGRIIDNVDNVDVATNEIITKTSLNRNFKKLLENDLKLDNFKQMTGLDIVAYDKDTIYKKGAIVWYRCKNPFNDSCSWFILKSMIDNNMHEPQIEIIDNQISFESSAWLDMNEFSTLMNNMQQYFGGYLMNQLNFNHELKSTYHKYGQLSSIAQLKDSVLLADMSNVSPDREYIHYPYQTIPMNKDNTVAAGYCRKWDCGLLEYFVLYRLGYIGQTKTKNGVNFNVVECNNLTLESNTSYLAENNDDQNIFNFKTTDSEDIAVNDCIETNQSKFVNSYSGKIIFTVPFIDANYMIFGSDVRRQKTDIDDEYIDAGTNAIAYTNRQPEYVCPIYITYPKNSGKKSVILQNNFHCHIVGRWK